jgi:citrate synthase
LRGSRDALACGRKVMGFGHRVYKDGDSRVPTMKEALTRVAEVREGSHWMRMYDALEHAMEEAKGIKPNLDFPTGPPYHLMGFGIPVFTPLFVVSRITGWTAHVAEQLEANALIRPLSQYAGAPQRSVPQAAVRLVA